MNDDPKMVELPWADGTTRIVPEWTVYEAVNGALYVARDGGYSGRIDPSTSLGRKMIYPYIGLSAAVRIFTEAPEPPIEVEVPTGISAVVSLKTYPNDPGYVLTKNGWLGLLSRREYRPDEIAEELRDGARVLFEGIEESDKSL